MPCATCDFGDPCACERERLRAEGLPVPRRPPRGTSTEAIAAADRRDQLAEAANVIAELLHAIASGDAPPETIAAAEALLAELRARAHERG